ncbi:TIGR01244 family sulfur transferase [Brevundimonas sp.]|uniref:TIGR01244 family sulfur transferase n=1 Tax=Brevundimonas sp. TaxID=1871086 RepID=UPI0025CB7B5D|nr:TIGR01244 family sulfur transferase [Brevundimonas sp.]
MRRLAKGFFVAPQVRPEDMAAVAEAGVRTVVNNRPDGEEPGQPTSAQMEAAARSAGLAYATVPFGGKPADADVAAMSKVLEDCDGPVLAFCRSGTRSAAVWARVQLARGAPKEELIEAGASAGYDLRPWLD